MSAVVEELPYLDPLRAFAPLAAEPGAILFDAPPAPGCQGDYAFIAADPFLVVTARDGVVTVGDDVVSGDPFVVLQQLLQRYRLPELAGLPPFQGGAAGFFGYELARHIERVPAPLSDDLQLPQLVVGLYDTVVSFDRRRQRAWIVASGLPEPPGRRARRAAWRARRWRQLLAKAAVAPLTPLAPISRMQDGHWTPDLSRAQFQAAVARVVEHIWAGDIFQANLAQRFSAQMPPAFSAFDLYRRLRQENPAPFASYLHFDQVTLASSSPERFLALRDGRVETRPIKGTRPRGRTPAEDRHLAQSLCESRKDRSENVMIVDLLRNDLSRVCCDHSVNVPALCALESYASVHHLVSTVVGRLRPGHDAIDLLRACFPGGSISGAPKVRAMEIIAQLEPVARGPYCGAIGYLGFDGTMDTSIAIRTLVLRDGCLTLHAGAGIVADSDPAAEYDETLVKAAALQSCLAGSAISRAACP